MTLLLIVSGDYGQVFESTIKDVDTGNAADISGYSTTQVYVFTQPDGTVVEKSAAFSDDGTDGKIKWTVTSGFWTSGRWRVRARLTSGAAELTTEEVKFDVKVDTEAS